MEAIIGALGQLGPIGIALVVLLIMWALNRQTASRYVEIIAEQRARIEHLNADHDAELAELQKNIVGLRKEISDLRNEIQVERTARMKAEEREHRLSLRLGEQSG